MFSVPPPHSAIGTTVPPPAAAAAPSTSFQRDDVPFHNKPGYRFKPTAQGPRPEELMQDGPGRRLRKNVANVRKHIDYVANCLRHAESRLITRGRKDRRIVQPDVLYQNYVVPPSTTPDVPIDCVCTKFVRAAMNKVKCPVYAVCWTPEGKRLITGASSGEFTLWNGTAFNFETILQAHDVAIRSLKWSHNDSWMASGDHDGFVKYWQPNMNNVHMFHAHKDDPVRSISFAPTDIKLATGSDDGTARIWDFARTVQEQVLSGHGADVRSVDWHPTKGLIATGSRDSQQPVKIWDPKTGKCLATLHDHKNSVTAVEWNRNGNWLLSGSRDHMVKLYDIRMMKEVQSFRGHKKEVTSIAWHPIHEGLFATGGGDGSMGYWHVYNDKEMALLENAHDQAVWSLRWHPLGHIIASGSNDNNTKFWARNRPGDTHEDIFGLTSITGGAMVVAAVTGSSAATNTSGAGANPAATGSNMMPIGASARDMRREVKGEFDATGDDDFVRPAIPGMGLTEMSGTLNMDVPFINAPGSNDMMLAMDNNGFSSSSNNRRGPMGFRAPPPKKAQRQFERIWNISKPSGHDMPEPPPFRGGPPMHHGPPHGHGPPPIDDFDYRDRQMQQDDYYGEGGGPSYGGPDGGFHGGGGNYGGPHGGADHRRRPPRGRTTGPSLMGRRKRRGGGGRGGDQGGPPPPTGPSWR